MPESPPPPPCVTVTLPGGGTVPGRLLAWHQNEAGRWHPEVAVRADAVTPVDGEDYAAVPRHPAQAAPEQPAAYAIAPLAPPDGPPHEVHDTARCWRTPVALARVVTAAEARDALAGGVGRCPFCDPRP